jgi:hypothetical protein
MASCGLRRNQSTGIVRRDHPPPILLQTADAHVVARSSSAEVVLLPRSGE